MPELPEIENLTRELRERLMGRTVVATRVGQPKVVNLEPDEFGRQARGVVTEVRRRGKHVVVSLAGGDLWLHLGMGGLVTLQAGQREGKVVVAFLLDDGNELAIERTFMGQAHFLDSAASSTRWSRLGIEPLSEEFSAERLAMLAARRPRWPLKVLLTEQELIAGIGNTYADEMLHRACLHPARLCGDLSAAEWERLYQATREVLEQAISEGGESEYQGLTSVSGRYRNQVHRAQASGRCGATPEKLPLRGRSTYYCPRCQPTP